MSKKFAVCFSGYPRFVEESFYNIKEFFLDGLGTFDIFANFQWSEEWRSQKIHHEFDKVFDKNELDAFIELYSKLNLKKIVVNRPFKYETSWLKTPSVEPDLCIDIDEARNILYRMKSQYQGIVNCINLIEDYDEYDFVIRLRTDLIFNKKLIKDDIISISSIVNQDGYHTGSDRTYSDWFFVCPINKIDFFNDLSNLEIHFKDGVVHMHKILNKLSQKYQIEARNLEIDTPSTSRAIKRFD
jgi:hypothetical protein